MLGSGSNLDANEINLQDFSRILTKLPNRSNKNNINGIVDKLFELAASKMKDDHDKAVIGNLRKYIGMVEEDLYNPKPRYLDAFFFPNERNIDRLISYLSKAQVSMNVCVFNMTNDKLANALHDAHKRGVKVRIISDDECMQSQGSDVKWLAEQGIPVRTDDNPNVHMHNKFVVIDNTHLITGSFNWTVQAGKSNQENLLVVDNPYYIEKYNGEFEGLWKQFERMSVLKALPEEDRREHAAKTI